MTALHDHVGDQLVDEAMHWAMEQWITRNAGMVATADRGEA